VKKAVSIPHSEQHLLFFVPFVSFVVKTKSPPSSSKLMTSPLRLCAFASLR